MAYKAPPPPQNIQKDLEFTAWLQKMFQGGDPIEDLPSGATAADIIITINKLLEALRATGRIRE